MSEHATERQVTSSGDGETTPVRTDTGGSSVPALPVVPVRRPWPTPPPSSLPTSLGWTLVLLGTLAVGFGSWTLYNTEASGMWAGYRDLVAMIVLGYALALLRCDLPRPPFIAACGLVGVLLIIAGVFLGETTTIMIVEVACGAVIVLGSALMASSPDR